MNSNDEESKVNSNMLDKLVAIYHKVETTIWYRYTEAKINEFSQIQISNASAAMAYYITMSLFPFMIFFVAVLARIGSRNFDLGQAVTYLKTLFPEPVVELLRPVIVDVTTQYHLSLLSIGVITILWGSSRGFDTFAFCMEKIYEKKPHPFWLKRLAGMLLILIITVFMLVFLIFVSFGNVLLRQLQHMLGWSIFFSKAINVGRFIFPFLLMGLLMSLIYHLISRRKGKFYWAIIAAIIPMSVWLVTSLGLSWYVDNFTKYDVIYGSLTGVILLLLWLYMLMLCIFLGAFVHYELITLFPKNFKQKYNPLSLGEKPSVKLRLLKRIEVINTKYNLPL